MKTNPLKNTLTSIAVITVTAISTSERVRKIHTEIGAVSYTS